MNLYDIIKNKYPNSKKFTNDLIVIDFGNVHKYCNEYKIYGMDSLFNVRPPFNKFFMQYEITGFYFEYINTDDEKYLNYLAETFILSENDLKVVGDFNFKVKESGELIGVCFMFPTVDEMCIKKLSYLVPYLRGTFHHALYAIQFMHCKNVKLVENVSSVKLSRQNRRQMERKQQPPPQKYYTLKIEPMKEVLRKEGNIEHNGLKKALHICRGHFRNYKEGKGLFGKYHGQYWIPMHVKGNIENGEIIKDYKVVI